MKLKYFGILIFSLTIVNAAVVPENSDIPVVIIDEIEPENAPINPIKSNDDDFILPEGIMTCRQNDPELGKCIRDAINHQLPTLGKGSTILNIPPLDPLRIPDGRYAYASGPVGGQFLIKNVNAYGATKAILKKVDAKLLKNGLASTMLVYFPRLFIEGTYKADVKLNEIKMRPKGFFNLTLSEVSIKVQTNGEYRTINGKKHLQLKKFDADPNIGDFKAYATGIFPDPQLNNIILDFVNQYWPEIVKTVVPQTQQIWEPLVLDAANKFLGTVPIEKILTKDE